MLVSVGIEVAEILVVAALLAIALTALRPFLPIAWCRRLRLRRWFVWLSAGVLLIKLTEDVLDHETGPGDEALLRWIHATAPVAWQQLMLFITDTAAFRVVCAIAVLSALVAFWRGHRRDTATLLLTPALAGVVIYLFKGGVDRTRPSLWATDIYGGSSFPSGHTLGAAALATALGLLARHVELKPTRVAARVLLALWVAAVAFSRMYLGVHWPTDVAAAACAGALVAMGVHTAAFHMRSQAVSQDSAQEPL